MIATFQPLAPPSRLTTRGKSSRCRAVQLIGADVLTSPGTDAASQASAAFAACSALYAKRTLAASSSPASLADSTYSSTLLAHARDLYAFATSASGGTQTYQTAVPAVGASYGSTGYGDELAIAALFLALAQSDGANDKSNASAAYADAVGHYYKFGLDAQMLSASPAFNWDGKVPGVVVLAAQLTKANGDLASGTNATLQVWQGAAETYFDALIQSKGRTYLTPGQSMTLVWVLETSC